MAYHQAYEMFFVYTGKTYVHYQGCVCLKLSSNAATTTVIVVGDGVHETVTVPSTELTKSATDSRGEFYRAAAGRLAVENEALRAKVKAFDEASSLMAQPADVTSDLQEQCASLEAVVTLLRTENQQLIDDQEHAERHSNRSKRPRTAPSRYG
jgi:hypothetical protein